MVNLAVVMTSVSHRALLLLKDRDSSLLMFLTQQTFKRCEQQYH